MSVSAFLVAGPGNLSSAWMASLCAVTSLSWRN